jgi:multidrug efflux pump subunit AcrB
LVKSAFTMAGIGFGGQGQNVGIAFVRLRPFTERRSAALSALAVAGRAMMALVPFSTFPSGAGSGAQNSIGIGIMGGMIASTTPGIIFVPFLFVIVRTVFKDGHVKRNAPQETDSTPKTIQP